MILDVLIVVLFSHKLNFVMLVQIFPIIVSGSYGGGGYGGGGRGFGGGGGGRGGGGGSGNPGSRLRDIDWSKENLKPIQKNFYHEHAAVARRDQYMIDQWIAENQVTLDGRGIPRPVFEFSEASFPNELSDLLYGKFQKPTVIQSISWPIAMSGRDIISIAKTGSGKTLAVRSTCRMSHPINFIL